MLQNFQKKHFQTGIFSEAVEHEHFIFQGREQNKHLNASARPVYVFYQSALIISVDSRLFAG